MHIELDPNVRPVHTQVGRVPVAKLDRVNEELERLSNKGIIKPVTQPAEWLSNILVKEKPNRKLQICIDSSQTINRAIRRPKYTIPKASTSNQCKSLHHCWRLKGLSHHPAGRRIILTYRISRAKRSLLPHQDAIWDSVWTWRVSTMATWVLRWFARSTCNKHCRRHLCFWMWQFTVLPLRDLTKENSTSLWSNNHENAFNSAKNLIASATALRYYNPTLPMMIWRCKRWRAVTDRSACLFHIIQTKQHQEELCLNWEGVSCHCLLHG